MENRIPKFDTCFIERYAMASLATFLGDGSIVGRNEYEYWSLALPLKRILEIKMTKVNDGFYGDFDEFGLFVFTKEDLDQIKQTVAFMISNCSKIMS